MWLLGKPNFCISKYNFIYFPFRHRQVCDNNFHLGPIKKAKIYMYFLLLGSAVLIKSYFIFIEKSHYNWSYQFKHFLLGSETLINVKIIHHNWSFQFLI